MFDTHESQQRITRWSWLVALATLLVGQLHALARFRTEDGKSDLDLPLTALWAEPADRALEPLLGWASADTVYLTYGKWWVVALGVMVAAGFMVMRRRAPYGVELWGWRIFLVGYTLLTVSVGAYYWGQWTSYNVMEDIGLWAQLPGALLGLVGATVLGIALLKRQAKPRLAAVLLVLNIPALFLIPQVTSLGNSDLPTLFAIALLAREVTASRQAAPARADELVAPD
jgi:hypothetical protein